MEETIKLVKRILIIICLTNIPMFFLLFLDWKKGLGWILGSLISGINFFWMATYASKNLVLDENSSKVKTTKSFFIRYLVLLVYSVLVMIIIKPDPISFGMGLLAAQISIYLNLIFEFVVNSNFYKKIRGQ